jgi:hypothetical protein
MYLGELETCGQKRVSLKLAYAGTAAAPASSGYRRRSSTQAHQPTSPAINTFPDPSASLSTGSSARMLFLFAVASRFRLIHIRRHGSNRAYMIWLSPSSTTSLPTNQNSVPRSSGLPRLCRISVTMASMIWYGLPTSGVVSDCNAWNEECRK